MVDFLCRRFCSSRRSSSAFDGGGGGGVREVLFLSRLPLLLPSPKRLSIVQSTPLSSRSLSNAAGLNARAVPRLSARRAVPAPKTTTIPTTTKKKKKTKNTTRGDGGVLPRQRRGNHRFDDSSTRFPNDAVFVAFDDDVVSSATTRETWRRDLSGRRHRFASSNWSRDFFWGFYDVHTSRERLEPKKEKRVTTKNDDASAPSIDDKKTSECVQLRVHLMTSIDRSNEDDDDDDD